MPVLLVKQWPAVRKEISRQLASLCLGPGTTDKGTLFAIIKKVMNGSPLENAFEAYFNRLDGLGWYNSDELIKALKRFHEIPEIHSILLTLRDQALSELHKTPPGAASISPDGSPLCETPDKTEEENPKIIDDMLHTHIVDWVVLTYPEVDERVISNDDKKQRRMDSLARLLSLPNHLSVCVAVTLDVYSPDCPPRLIISANIGQEGAQREIYRSILEKINIIRDHITRVSPARISAMEEGEYHLFTSALSRALRKTRGPFPEAVLEQAVNKLCHAICIDSDTFNEEEKSAFLEPNRTVVLLASKEGSASKLNVITHLKPEAYLLSNVPAKCAVKYIHAEQLITQYLFKINGIRPPETLRLPIGISKLCCKTCFDHLGTYPVSFRGCHNQSYLGVVDLDKGTSSTTSKPRRATTAAFNSPGDSHKRRWMEVYATRDETVRTIHFEEETKDEPADTPPGSPKPPRLSRRHETDEDVDAENHGIQFGS